MKRIYACFAIVAILLAAAFFSSWQVQQFAREISEDLDCAVAAIRDNNPAAARKELADLRTADFTELEAALRAADGHLEMGAPEEALGELRRAQVQVETLEWLSRRLI